MLLDAVRKRTPTDADRAKIRTLLGQLASGDFATRETASKELFALGRRSLPQLREATKNKDIEVSRRAKLLMMLQSAISLLVLAILAARAINTLGS